MLCLLKTAKSNLRGLPFLGTRTRVTHHSILPCAQVPSRAVSSVISVSRAGHLEVHGGPRNQHCSASRVSSAMSVSSPQSAASSHSASSASLAREVLLMFTPSLPSCTCFRHPDQSLLMNSAIPWVVPSVSMRRASFQVARVANTTSSTNSAVFALDTISKCTRDLQEPTN